MELFNQLFYLTYGAIVLVIFFGSFAGKDFKLLGREYQYWPTALVLMIVSSLSFVLSAFSPQYFLSLANSSLVFSGLATILFIRSWRMGSRILKPQLFWIGLLGFLVFYEGFRQLASFETRVLLMGSILTVINVWGIYEVHAQSKRETSAQLYILTTAFVFQIAFMVFRSYVSSQQDSGALTVYQEDVFPAILRAIGVASNLLVYIAIGNLLLERSWKKEEKKSSNAELRMLSSLNALALARDNETGSHIIRTQGYVKRLAQRLKQNGQYADQLSDKQIESLYKAAPLHDVGKVGIPDHILYKEGPLNKDEWGIMKTHTTIGEYVLSSAKAQLDEVVEDDDVIEAAIAIAGSHHERWDGQGYPRGVSGQDIPLSARIMALADMYDALVSERVYKREWSHQDAVDEIIRKKGSHFDPLVVDAFVAEKDEFQAIAQKHKDDVAEFKVFADLSQSSEHKLRRSEEKFQVLFEHSPIGMALVEHVTGKFLEVNTALLGYTGYTKEEFLNLSFWDITPIEYAAQEEAQIADLNRTGSFGPNKKEYIRKDGSRFPISLSGFMLNDAEGRKMVWGIIEDISIKEKTQKQAAARNAVLELLAKNSPTEVALFQIASDVEKTQPGTFCSILILGPDKKSFKVGAAPRIPTYFSEAVESLEVAPGVGCCGDAVTTGKNSFAHNLEADPNWAAYQSLVQKSGFKSCWSHPVYSSKGEVLGTLATYRLETYTPTDDEIADVGAAANLVSIVLERKGLESQVQKLALYDYLTGLPNRYLLMDRLKSALSVSKRSRRYGALLFVDLDGLKTVNDQYGHYAGDALLVQSSKRMQSCLREIDTVARFGGDEFVIVLSEISLELNKAVEQVKIISEKILAALVEPYHLEFDHTQVEYCSSASIGCKVFIDEVESPEQILRLADMSMYRAKKLGGNRADLLY